MSEYDEKYYSILKKIILSVVDPDQVMVFLFGSRVTGTHALRSDVDIGLLADEKIPEKIFHQIRNTIDASVIPWNVDVVDFTRVDPDFKKEAMREIIIWNKPGPMRTK